jgi:hypothetical protein
MDRGKGGRGLTRCGSNSCFVPCEEGATRSSRQTAEAAATAMHLTTPAVTPEAEGQSLESRVRCATKHIDAMDNGPIAHSKWTMCLWGVAVRRGFLTVKELPLKGLVRCEIGHQDARLGKAIVW